ncbi:MAG: hypothetical protein KAW19_00570 [Candidatus Aminicenantes bacterium]|nr:hypothetical protein [Candidatus Aminicenantes bacterium]
MLPLEFSRISDSRNGALTLVIDVEKGKENSSFYTFSKRGNAEDAFADLRCREKTNNKNIGMINILTGYVQSKSNDIADRVKKWANTEKIDVVIWTDLSSNFHKKRSKPFSPAIAVEYLKDLKVDGLFKACNYIELTSPEIVTPLRSYLSENTWYQDKRKILINKNG